MEHEPQSQPSARTGAVRSALDRILLRKKETPGETVLSASRGPAAEALAAANYTPPPAAPTSPERLSDIPDTAVKTLPDVPALHTFKGDIASTIEERRISLAAIAQAASERAHAETATSAHPSRRLSWLKVAEVSLGILFLTGAAGLLGFLYLQLRPVAPAPGVSAPIIFVDHRKEITVMPGESRATLMDKLTPTALSPGLVEGVILTSSTSTGTQTITAREFFLLAAPQAPDLLVRALNTQFLLGFHTAEGSRPFLIFKTESYAAAFAGMLEWEYSMQDDLAPLFPKPATVAPVASEAATSTAPSSQTPGGLSVINTPFSDAILDNHDVRLIRQQPQAGDADGVVLLWSLVDRSTLVITNDPATLSEIISRLQKAPTITVPGR